MTVTLVNAEDIRLAGVCPADDAERLLQHLILNPAAAVDWRDCEEAHGAVIQVLVTTKRQLRGPPAGQFLRQFIDPALTRI